jgi:hypothetical protein
MKKNIDYLLTLIFFAISFVTIAIITAADISAADTTYYLNEEIGNCFCAEGIQGVSYCCAKAVTQTLCDLDNTGVPIVPDKSCYWEDHLGESDHKCGAATENPQY